jgi:hypothetical protein
LGDLPVSEDMYVTFLLVHFILFPRKESKEARRSKSFLETCSQHISYLLFFVSDVTALLKQVIYGKFF